MFGRGKRIRTHRELAMDQLAESYEHMKLAASHLADGAAERLTPRYDRAREAAGRQLTTAVESFTPLYDQLRDTAVAHVGRAHPPEPAATRRRWPVLIGLIAAGTAVGAVGAIAARRKRAASQWDDFEPLAGIDDGFVMTDPPSAGGIPTMADPGLARGSAPVNPPPMPSSGPVNAPLTPPLPPSDSTMSAPNAPMSPSNVDGASAHRPPRNARP